MKSIRNALASEHAAIAAHPQDPTNYIELAYTLTDAGAGEMARSAAADATRVAPKSSLAYSAQGWVLHHNDIGVDYGTGFDYNGALQAYRKAIELDPHNLDVRESLGNLLDHNAEGVEHASDAQLGMAIETYRYVIQHQKVIRPETVRNLALDLFYSGRYEEAIKELTHRPLDDVALGALLASVAALKGSAAAIELSSQIGGDEQHRKDALNTAAEGLWNKRLYAESTNLMKASLPDTAEGPAIAAKIQLFQNLKPFVPEDLPTSDPRRPVQTLMEKALMGTLDEASMKDLLSSHSYAADDASGAEERESAAMAGTLLPLTKKTGLPRVLVADIVLGRMTIQASADPGDGAPIRVQVAGLPPWRFFVVSENGNWKIAAAQQDLKEIGEQALYLLASGRANTANALLDWYYSLLEPQRDANDPLSGDLFARLWMPRERTTPKAPLMAALSLSSDEASLRRLLPELLRIRDQTSDERRRDDLDMLLATVYFRLKDAPHAHAASAQLLGRYPASDTALHLAGEAYELSKDWAAWKEMLAQPLEAEPNDRHLLLESAAEATAARDYGRARQAYQAILDGSHALSADYTQYAWLSLFQGKPEDKAYAAAQQAMLNTTSRGAPSLLTMACIDAERGNTAEAHQELLDAMSSAQLTEPDGGMWFGFGLIFEQYGLDEAAVSAYRKAVQKPAFKHALSTSPKEPSVSTLANLRLSRIEGKTGL